MATRLARKTCPRCGTECLESEALCWACGALFAPRAGSAAPTLVGTPPKRPRRAGRPYLLCGVAVAAFTLLAGVALHLAPVWYQAGSGPTRYEAVPPLQMPTSGATVSPAPEPGSDRAAVSAPPAVAPRRSRTNRPPRSISDDPRFARVPRFGISESTMDEPDWQHKAQPVPPSDRSSSSVLQSPSRNPKSGYPREAWVIPNQLPAAPGDALVTLRNGTSSALDFEFAPDRLSGTVAPHSQLVLPLAGGEYDLHLRTGGRSETLYDVRLEAGQRYLVTFDSRNARVSGQ